MRRNLYLAFLAAFVLPPMWGVAAVIDRVALVVNNKVITEGEVVDELRVTEFLNNEPLDFGPTARRAAADRLVDQELLRNEMNLTGYAQPPAADAEVLLRNFREQHYPSAAVFDAALKRYGVTENELKERLLWQVTALRFSDFRFGSELPEAASPSADRADESEGKADDQMTTWLKQARENTKIVFKPEAFQ